MGKRDCRYRILKQKVKEDEEEEEGGDEEGKARHATKGGESSMRFIHAAGGCRRSSI